MVSTKTLDNMCEEVKAQDVTIEDKTGDTPAPLLQNIAPDFGKPWYKISFLRRLNLFCFLLIVTSFTSGYDGSMMNGIQSLPVWQEDFDYPTGSRLGLLATIQGIGLACTLPIGPILSDHLGRRHPIAIGSMLCVIGGILQSASQNFNTFLAGRWLLGFGYGFVFNAAAPLLSELAYPKHRATVTGLFGTTWYIGSIVAAWSTYGTFKLESSWSWRIPSLLQVVPSFIQLATIYFIPESPRWLISRGKVDKARQFLTTYHAGGDEDSVFVAHELSEIVTAIETEKKQNKMSYLAFFNSRANIWRLFITLMMGLIGQWSGNGLISFYLIIILKSIGITDGETQNKINGGLQIFNYVTSTMGALLINRFGRRKMMLVSIMGMASSFLIWTILSAINEQKGFEANYGIGIVCMIFLFNLFYNVALNPIALLYVMEVLPFNLRAKGITLTGFTGMAAGLFNGFVNPIGLEAIGWRYYIIFVVLTAVWFIVVFVSFPETKDRSLEEVSQLFDGPEARLPIQNYLNPKRREDHETA